MNRVRVATSRLSGGFLIVLGVAGLLTLSGAVRLSWPAASYLPCFHLGASPARVLGVLAAAAILVAGWEILAASLFVEACPPDTLPMPAHHKLE